MCPGCVGLGVAAREAYKDFDARIEKLYTLREHLIAGLKPLGGVTINGSEDRTNAPQIVSASFEGVRSEVLLHALEDKWGLCIVRFRLLVQSSGHQRYFKGNRRVKKNFSIRRSGSAWVI